MSTLHLTGGVPKEALRAPARVSSGSIVWSVAERVLAGGLLIALLPVMAAISLAVALVSRKSPFIAHRRLGRYGQEFWMLKIRTMWDRREPRPTEVGAGSNPSSNTSATRTSLLSKAPATRA